ncbi:MAG: hypothetical protein WA691_05055 [Thermoplasmata archaeon]
MSTPSKTPAQVLDQKGVRRLGLGAGLGFAGAIAAIVLPLAFLFVVTAFPGGFFTFSSMLIEVTSILILTGAILLLLSLFVYRRGFAALRKVDPRFYAASILCILGSIGFLLILIAAAVTLGNVSSLLSCAHGHPSHALSCLESGQPLGAVTGLVGFLLGWIGGVGIVIGLLLAGSRFRARALSGSGVVYGLLLVILIVPLVSLFVSIPDTSYLLILAPLLALVGPGLALAGSVRTTRGLTET